MSTSSRDSRSIHDICVNPLQYCIGMRIENDLQYIQYVDNLVTAVKEVRLEVVERRNDGIDVPMESWHVCDVVHAIGKLLLDSVEYVLDRPINWIIGSTVDNAVASSHDHLRNDWVAVGDEIVHQETSAAFRSSWPNIVEDLLDKVHKEL